MKLMLWESTIVGIDNRSVSATIRQASNGDDVSTRMAVTNGGQYTMSSPVLAYGKTAGVCWKIQI